nr:glycosyltransferase [Okeania sp. SIO1H5]
MNWLFVGRIEHRKGIDTLLSALETADTWRFRPHLRIIGALPHRPNSHDSSTRDHFLRSKASQPSLLEHLDSVPHQEMIKHYDWASVVILPSLIENYPYVLLEALSRGCYVIASRTGGIPEIIQDQRDGYLFPPGDIHALRSILGCLDTSSQVSSRCRVERQERFAANHLPGPIIESLLRIYGDPDCPSGIKNGKMKGQAMGGIPPHETISHSKGQLSQNQAGF